MNFKNLFVLLITFFSLSLATTQAQSRYNKENRPVKIAQKAGKASYYGRAWNGRKTACGEVFNTDSFTCAHKTLPFGTMLKVTNKKNGKSVVVRVTDRGPFVRGRIIDLTLAAAKKIDMVHAGVANVEIDQIFVPANIPTLESDGPVLPDFQLYDHNTGKYYTMAEWEQREAHRKDIAKAKAGNVKPTLNNTLPSRSIAQATKSTKAPAQKK